VLSDEEADLRLFESYRGGAGAGLMLADTSTGEGLDGTCEAGCRPERR
jgi:hypothetical protein